MKILWHGVPGYIKTGYGIQTKLMVTALRAAGHDVAVNCRMDQYQNGVDAAGVVHYASGSRWNCMGNEYIIDHANRFNPDIVLSMCDPFTCEPSVFAKLHWYPWVMVDSEPLRWQNAESLKACRRPISPTKHGVKVLKDAGYDPLYVPLAIDTTDYFQDDKETCRAALSAQWGVDLSDKFLAVMNSANHSNPSRKNFGAAFQAWAMFTRQHPDSVLYIHAEKCGKQWYGENLDLYLRMFELDNVVFAPQYEYCMGEIGADYLRTVYSGADVFLHTAYGEGFGLPIVEAQACGCPVITPEFGAMGELNATGPALECKMMALIEGALQGAIDPKEASLALRDAYYGNELRVDAALVIQYDIRTVMEKNMAPALESIKTEIATTKENDER